VGGELGVAKAAILIVAVEKEYGDNAAGEEKLLEV